MPSLTKCNCSNGCGRQTQNGGRCTGCQKQAERQRPARSVREYDKNHSRLRIQCFERDGWKCVDCGWEPGVVKQCRDCGLDVPPTNVILEELRQQWHGNKRHLHGDHDFPIEQRPDLRLDLDNYRTRCNECHSAKTIRENNPNQGC
jgi:hypothetical protein